MTGEAKHQVAAVQLDDEILNSQAVGEMETVLIAIRADQVCSIASLI